MRPRECLALQMVGELLQKLYVGVLAPKGDIVQRLPYGIAFWNVTGDLDLSEARLRVDGNLEGNLHACVWNVFFALGLPAVSVRVPAGRVAALDPVVGLLQLDPCEGIVGQIVAVIGCGTSGDDLCQVLVIATAASLGPHDEY